MFNRILQGDVREVLKTLPEKSVQCCVTSPPYWGLRDYGTAKWEGGSAECDHSTPRSRGDDIKTGDKQGTSAGSRPNTRTECECGAKRIDSQLGLEKTPEEYVANMVEVFREVRRVLRDDGTLWLNLGDSYNGSSGSHQPGHGNPGISNSAVRSGSAPGRAIDTLKPKDLVGIPWRVAFALQADGWYLRQDIIWAKPNPMPESVTDRCTKSHEYIFLMSKSQKYYYDHEAIREPVKPTTTGVASVRASGDTSTRDKEHWGIPHEGRGNVTRTYSTIKGANRRSVWTIPTSPYKGAHFATFPEKLVEPMILAGSPVGGLVLDPFTGSGTTLAVAKRLQRNYIGTELNHEYIKLAEDRIGSVPVPLEL